MNKKQLLIILGIILIVAAIVISSLLTYENYAILLIGVFLAGSILLFTLAAGLEKTLEQKQKNRTKALTSLGIIFFVVGISSNNSAMWSLGLIFFIVGLINKITTKRSNPTKKKKRKKTK